MPLARAAAAAGHEVAILARAGSRSGDVARAAGFRVSTTSGNADWSTVALILFAVAPENADRFRAFGHLKAAFRDLARDSAGVPLASVSAPLDPAALTSIFGQRPIVRFVCSAAITDPAALRLYDADGHSAAASALVGALPSAEWRSVPARSLARYTALLTAAALVSVPLVALTKQLGPLNTDEESFLLDTLQEARRLIDANARDPGAALASASTPGGMTEQLKQRLYGDSWFRSDCAYNAPRKDANPR